MVDAKVLWLTGIDIVVVFVLLWGLDGKQVSPELTQAELRSSYE
jgi:hypothetical protein